MAGRRSIAMGPRVRIRLAPAQSRANSALLDRPQDTGSEMRMMGETWIGTEGLNPALSSGESTNFRFLARRRPLFDRIISLPSRRVPEGDIGRDFAAWLGLTPLQKSTGGKQKLGAVSKRGERTIRRLLIIGASAVVQQASRRGAPKGSWLAQMLARKPKMLVTVALANKMARIIWALLVKGGTYRTPTAAA